MPALMYVIIFFFFEYNQSTIELHVFVMKLMQYSIQLSLKLNRNH